MVLQPFGLFNSVCVGWSPGSLVLPSSQIFLGWQQVHPSNQDQSLTFICTAVSWCSFGQTSVLMPSARETTCRWTTFSQCSGAFSFHSITVERIYCEEKCTLIKRTIHRGGWRSRMLNPSSLNMTWAAAWLSLGDEAAVLPPQNHLQSPAAIMGWMFFPALAPEAFAGSQHSSLGFLSSDRAGSSRGRFLHRVTAHPSSCAPILCHCW